MSHGRIQSSQHVADAILAADLALTPLDDKIDVEDVAVYHWLRAHRLHAGHLSELVIGSEVLPRAWREHCLKISSLSDAEALIQRLKPDAHAMAVLRKLAQPWTTPARGGGDKVMLSRVAAALLSGELWALEITHAPTSRWVGKTDPQALAAINPNCGTKIDFATLSKYEGAQWRRGYIPIRKKTGLVVDSSGMTISTGFDLGQWSEQELNAMGFSDELIATLRPYCQHPFKGKTRAQVASLVAKLGPVPIITKKEADQIDSAVFARMLRDAIGAWDRSRARGVPNFIKMPAGWQTVLFSRTYQDGAGYAYKPLSRAFAQAAFHGRWIEAIAALRSFAAPYTARGEAEAKLCEAALPPPLPHPAHKPSVH